MPNFTKLENVKHANKKLRLEYILETNVFKSSKILKKWESNVKKMHQLQDEVINFYLPKPKKHETKIYYLSEILHSI